MASCEVRWPTLSHRLGVRMVRLSSRLSSIGTGFAKYFQKPPEDVIRLTIGEPDLDTPKAISEAAIAALRDGQTHYSRSLGLERTTRAVSTYLSRGGLEVEPDDIMITNGAKQALFSAMLAIGDPGQSMIIPSPAWASYNPQLKACGLHPIHVPLDQMLHLDIPSIEAAIDETTAAIIVNSPNNPTGSVYTTEELTSLVEVAIEHDLWLISDEIYAPMVWLDDRNHIPIASLPGAKNRTVTIGGWSKGWAMTGWRLGWITGPSSLIDHVSVVQANTVTHPPTFLQIGAAVALEDETLVEEIVTPFRERRSLVLKRLQAMPNIVVPELEGAFYAFIDIRPTGLSDLEFVERLLSEARVQTIPGSLMPFGEGWVRLSYTASTKDLIEGLDRMESWLHKLDST
ncbi:MAG: aromatic amino acid aminotransferase [Euryarchaeota archaeon]|nr:aromatic amino acid aminotransferase [Euryarchaeota archaeon]MBG17706.1 aromatic amino acid aminotransferase [Euryarchaeota archaeon]